MTTNTSTQGNNIKPKWWVLVVAAVLIGAGGAALAQDTNLQSCRYSNGLKIPADECAVYQRLEREKQEAAERARLQSEQSRAAEAARQKERDDKAAQDRLAYQARQQREQAELDGRTRAYEEEREREDRIERQQARRSLGKTEALKASCGSDYLAPKIGMPIGRALQCVGKYKLTAQLNRADGVVTTYTGAAGYLHVMDGRVVAWGH